ncbi:MAG: phenylalanine--tRNA ligase subunit beta [Phycisphaeraceae bacterium]
MKVSLDWLHALIDRPLSAAEVESIMTAQGFPLEGREEINRPDGSTDTVLDLEVTSNRGDCLSHLGVARELAAGAGCALLPPDAADLPESDPPADTLTCVDLQEPELCPVYTARVLRGVKVGPSPEWLVRRLEALGLRSVNNVVDVTNYVLFELGQPLHAFDLAKLDEGRIVVRRATKGEPFTAIDGTKHELPEHALVIADASRPRAVAGVMGGLDSEVGDDTTDVLLESARFDPVAIRRASRSLKLASDSSYRYERGVDPLGVEAASRRAAKLIVELAGGELARGVVRVGESQESLVPTDVAMRTGRCNALLGLDLTPADMVGCLDRLGLSPRLEGETIRCAVPSFRLDLRREVDLMEEVARITGLDATPVKPKMAIVAVPPRPGVEARRELARVLIAHGYHETITPSFLPTAQAEAFLDETGGKPMTLTDDRRRAEPSLRTSLLPSLLRCRKTNQDVGNAGVKLFELARAWILRDEKHHESLRLALLADGEDGETAIRAMKGALAELAHVLAGEQADEVFTVEPCKPGRCDPAARLSLHGREIGTMGLASADLLDRFDLQTPVLALAELDAEPLLACYPPTHRAGELPRFPAVERDLSIIVEESRTWRELSQVIDDAQPQHVERLDFLGAYRGKPIAKGSKSVALRLRFRRSDATLTGEAVDAEMTKVVEALRKQGAELRG